MRTLIVLLLLTGICFGYQDTLAIKTAENLYTARDYMKASKAYEKIYVATRDSIALERIILCSYYLKDFGKVQDAAESFLMRTNSRECRRVLLNSVFENANIQPSIVALAIQAHVQCLQKGLGTKEEYLALARLYKRVGKGSEANQVLKDCLGKYTDPELAIQIALDDYGKGDFESAVKYFAKANLTGTPDNLYKYGRALYKVKRYAEAVTTLSVCEKVPGLKLPELFRMLAESYENLKNIEKAVKYYILTGSNDSGVCFHIADIQEGLDASRAKDLYVENTKKFPRDVRNFRRLAGILYTQKDFKGTKQALDVIKGLDSGITIGELSRLAECCKATKDREGELKAYAGVLLKEPRNFQANKVLGLAAFEDEKAIDALAYLEVARALEVNDPDILSALGLIYLKSKWSEEGLMMLQSAKKLKPSARTYLALIDAYKRYGKNREAALELADLLKIDRSFGTLNLYAKTLYQMKNYKETEEILKEMRLLKSEDIGLILFTVAVKVDQGQFDEAIEFCKMASYIDPKNVGVMCNRAEIYAQKKNLDRAREYYQKALKTDSTCIPAKAWLSTTPRD